jgi:hypothetical protein
VANTWITDMTHFLEAGRLAPTLPGPARKLVEHLGAIVAAVTSDDALAPTHSRVACRRRPKRRPCTGEIQAWLDLSEDAICWRCPVCGDNGVIRGWEGTLWDCIERGESH